MQWSERPNGSVDHTYAMSRYPPLLSQSSLITCFGPLDFTPIVGPLPPSELFLANDNLHYQKGHCANGGFSEINQQLQFLREGLIRSNAISLYSKNSQGHIMKRWRGNDRSSRGLEREVSYIDKLTAAR